MSAIKKTKKRNQSKGKVIQLRLIPSESNQQKAKLVNGLWKVAQSALWNGRDFSIAEQEELKQLLAEHFEGNKNIKRNFKDLVERICLAKRFVSRRKGRYISKPIDWLNINYRNGLVGTASWLEEVKEQRKSVPHYNEGITTLANGILKYMESPNIMVFLRYRKMLIEQKQFDLLQIFQITIINLQYIL